MTASAAAEPGTEQSAPGTARGSGPALGSVAVLVLAGLVVLMAGLKSLAGIFGPSFLAFSLVIAVRPVRLWLLDRRVPRWAATVVVAVFLYAVLLGLIVSMAWSVALLVEKLPDYQPRFVELYAQVQTLMTQLGVSQTDLGNQALTYLQPARVLSALTAVLSGLSSAGSQMFVLIMVMAFLMIDSTLIEGRRGEILTARPGLGQAFEDFSRRTSKYWVVNTVFGAIVSVFDIIALMVIGVPLAFTWGLFAFVTNYIPNVGFVIGLVPPALLALLEGGPTAALWVVVTFSVINFVAQSVIQPKITGDAVGLNTTVTFLSLMFWAAVIGPLGAILAVPLTLFFKAVLIDADPRSRWIGVAFDSRGKPIDLRWTTRLLADRGRISLRQAYGRGPDDDRPRAARRRSAGGSTAASVFAASTGQPSARAQGPSSAPASPDSRSGSAAPQSASQKSPSPKPTSPQEQP